MTLDQVPPEIRQWIMETFAAVSIDGFNVDGEPAHIYFAQNTMAEYALDALLDCRNVTAADPGDTTEEQEEETEC